MVFVIAAKQTKIHASVKLEKKYRSSAQEAMTHLWQGEGIPGVGEL